MVSVRSLFRHGQHYQGHDARLRDYREELVSRAMSASISSHSRLASERASKEIGSYAYCSSEFARS